jgi:hypothetical protein
MTVAVTSTTSGGKVNTTGNVTSTNGRYRQRRHRHAGDPLGAEHRQGVFAESVAVGGVATLTFTITNPNAAAALTGVAFTDSFQAGLEVAATPNASTGCGSPTFAPAAGNTSISFSGGTIGASGTAR